LATENFHIYNYSVYIISAYHKLHNICSKKCHHKHLTLILSSRLVRLDNIMLLYHTYPIIMICWSIVQVVGCYFFFTYIVNNIATALFF